MITSGLMSADRDDWETPLWLFRELDNEFHFTLDAAASDDNHKCQKYFTKKTDAIVNDWSGNVVFCNPPYGKQIKAWCRKAYEESLKPDTTVVMLIPARTDAGWFVWFDLMKLPMDDEADADRFIKDIADGLHNKQPLIYWYDN